MTPWKLPTSLEVGGVGYSIRTDFRDVLYLIGIFTDPEYEADEKAAICLQVLYENWEDIPPELCSEALERAVDFIDMGAQKDGGRQQPHLMDWEQDAHLIIPAVNRVLGQEVRAVEYLHWWTFLGAYMEIGESVFSQVLSIRQKLSEGKKLEKHERAFYRKNRSTVDLKTKYTEAEDELLRQWT